MFNVNILEPQNIITAILVSVLAASVMGAIPAGGYVGEIFYNISIPFSTGGYTYNGINRDNNRCPSYNNKCY